MLDVRYIETVGDRRKLKILARELGEQPKRVYSKAISICAKTAYCLPKSHPFRSKRLGLAINGQQTYEELEEIADRFRPYLADIITLWRQLYSDECEESAPAESVFWAQLDSKTSNLMFKYGPTDLLSLTREEILSLDGMGPHSLKKIANALEEAGYIQNSNEFCVKEESEEADQQRKARELSAERQNEFHVLELFIAGEQDEIISKKVLLSKEKVNKLGLSLAEEALRSGLRRLGPFTKKMIKENKELILNYWEERGLGVRGVGVQQSWQADHSKYADRHDKNGYQILCIYLGAEEDRHSYYDSPKYKKIARSFCCEALSVGLGLPATNSTSRSLYKNYSNEILEYWRPKMGIEGKPGKWKRADLNFMPVR